MNNWGGKRKGAGRKADKGETRKLRVLRATDKEWSLIKVYAKKVKGGVDNAD